MRSLRSVFDYSTFPEKVKNFFQFFAKIFPEQSEEKAGPALPGPLPQSKKPFVQVISA